MIRSAKLLPTWSSVGSKYTPSRRADRCTWGGNVSSCPRPGGPDDVPARHMVASLHVDRREVGIGGLHPVAVVDAHGEVPHDGSREGFLGCR